jgi:arylsulfatase A-like enzyme
VPVHYDVPDVDGIRFVALIRGAGRVRLWVGTCAAALLFGLASCGGDEPPAGVAGPAAPAGPATSRNQALPPAGPPAALVRNVLIVSVDTLRADRLGPYGYQRPTSPNLSALAQKAVVFTRAQSQSAQTAPSHASLFTSAYGETHGLINVHGDASQMRTLPAGLATLAEVVQRAGLETAAFVSDGNLTRGMGMSRGFGLWDEKNEDVSGRVAALLGWMESPDRQRFLALLHTYQVHAPYVPPADVAQRFIDKGYTGPLRARLERYWTLPWEKQWAGGVGADYWEGMLEYTAEDVRFLSDLYDGEIAYADDVLRKVFQELLTGVRSKDTALVVLSDHGEEFRDHGKFQHDQVFQELIHVPLLVRVPSAVTRVPWTGEVESPVELVDVAPTITELLGVDASQAGWAGRSLVPLLDPLRRGASGDPERAQFSELGMETDHGEKVFRTITWHGWKYIHGEQPGMQAKWEWLFDLSKDPHEKADRLADTGAEVVAMLAELRRRLDEHTRVCLERAASAGASESVNVPDELRENLNQIGYTGR